MSKNTFYLKHDLDARNDPKLVNLRMTMGAKGYGIYWLIVEKMYSEAGKLARDWKALSWEFHESQEDIKAVAEDYDLFYDNEGKLSCHRVDRDIAHRLEIQMWASNAGKASVLSRGLQLRPNGRSTGVEQGEERRGELGDITTANDSPSAVDFSGVRLPKGMGAYGGAYVRNIPADEAQFILDRMRPGRSLALALKWRISLKMGEATERKNDGLKKINGEKP